MGSFPRGSTVTLTATPDAGSEFAGWLGAGCSGTGICTVTADMDKGVAAKYNAPPTYSLTVETDGDGSGTVTSDPAGIDCGTTCSGEFAQDRTVTLTATADEDSVFSGWSGACSGTSDCTVTMDATKTVTATFEPSSSIASYTLTVDNDGDGSGTVTSSPAGINCGTDCQQDYAENTTVTLTATPDAGSAFDGWSGGGCSGTGNCALTITADTTATATFDQDEDTDGASGAVENAGPNNGDGNNDGILDSEQANVATFPNANGEYVTLVAGAGTFTATSTTSLAGMADAPEGVDFPASLYGFTISGLEAGQSVQATLLLHGETTDLDTYYKYGPTPDDASDHWYEFLKGDNETLGADISQTENGATIVIYLQDGAKGDNDLIANGTIVDPGGPTISQDQTGGSTSSGGGGGCFVGGLLEL